MPGRALPETAKSRQRTEQKTWAAREAAAIYQDIGAESRLLERGVGLLAVRIGSVADAIRADWALRRDDPRIGYPGLAGAPG